MKNEAQLLDEHFQKLPQIVQDAITSADVEKHLHELSKTHQLHFDQWQELETEVMTALMGLKPVSALEGNIKKYVRVNDETARALAEDISRVVFAPIRSELDRFLSERKPPQPEGEPIEDFSDDILKDAGLRKPPDNLPTEVPTQQPIMKNYTQATLGTSQAQSSTPHLPPKPTVTRKEVPETYKPGTPSTERKDIRSDPYREMPDV